MTVLQDFLINRARLPINSKWDSLGIGTMQGFLKHKVNSNILYVTTGVGTGPGTCPGKFSVPGTEYRNSLVPGKVPKS